MCFPGNNAGVTLFRIVRVQKRRKGGRKEEQWEGMRVQHVIGLIDEWIPSKFHEDDN